MLHVLLVALIAALVVVLAKTAHDSRRPSAADRARAEQQAAEIKQRQPVEQMRAKCEQAQEQERQQTEGQGSGAAVPDLQCDKITAPTAADLLPDNVFHYASGMRGRIIAFGVVLALFGFVVGAGFAGAEWTAGTFGALLTWEPRRLRILGAKAVALACIVAAVAIVVTIVNLGGHYGIARWRGDADHLTSGTMTSFVLVGLRTVALAVVAALLGQALAGLVRSTAAALGVAFAYAIGAELALRNLWHGSERWLLTNHISAWLNNGHTVYSYSCPAFGDCVETSFTISLLRGASYLLVLIVIVMALDAAVLRRRDIV
jgi:ABC-2 type transport system permease protein